MRSALVVGGGGHVGGAVVRTLAAQGWAVTALVRRRPADGAGSDARVRTIGWADPPPAVDVVIDAAAPYARDGVSPARAADQHLGALWTLVGPRRTPLVHVGSFATAVALPPDPLSDVLRAQPYFETKARIEEGLFRWAARGAPLLVVSPTMCIGPWDPKPRALCIIPQLARGELPAVFDHAVDLVDVRDVAQAIARLVDRPWTTARLPLVGHRLPMIDAARRVAALAGVRPPARAIPAGLAAAGMLGLQAALRWAGLRPDVPALAALLVRALPAELASPAQAALGLPLTPLDVSLADAVAWYRAIGYC